MSSVLFPSLLCWSCMLEPVVGNNYVLINMSYKNNYNRIMYSNKMWACLSGGLLFHFGSGLTSECHVDLKPGCVCLRHGASFFLLCVCVCVCVCVYFKVKALVKYLQEDAQLQWLCLHKHEWCLCLCVFLNNLKRSLKPQFVLLHNTDTDDVLHFTHPGKKLSVLLLSCKHNVQVWGRGGCSTPALRLM